MSVNGNEELPLFQIGWNKESQLTPLALLVFVLALFPLSLFKMPELILVAWPVLGVFLWLSIYLVKQSRKPWITAKTSGLEIRLRVDNKFDFIALPWETIKSFELSEPYKGELVINLVTPINVGDSKSGQSQLTASAKLYDIDPDDLLTKLSNCLNPGRSSTNGYIPNIIPLKDRVASSILALILSLWALYGIVNNDLPIPTKREAWHLHGMAMWLMAIAFTLGAANNVALIADHYDQRNNEKQYRIFRAYSKITGYLMFGIALAAGLSDVFG